MPRTHYAPACLLAALTAFGQASRPAYSDPAAPPFLVRLQRTTADRQVCASIRADGLFHLERQSANREEVEEGMLNEAEVGNLKTTLNNEQLVTLNQQKIVVPLIAADRDVVSISILRSPLTQNLSFRGKQSRAPFTEYIDPLLHWLDALQKHSHTNLAYMTSGNNCLPPRQIQLRQRPAQLSAQSATASDSAPPNNVPSSST